MNWPSLNSEPTVTGFGPVFLQTPNLPEFGERNGPIPGLYPVLSQNFEPAEPGFTCSNSELKLRTLGKNTTLDHIVWV